MSTQEINTMRKLEMKLPTSTTLNCHRQPQNISESTSQKECSSTSPTFARVSCSKSVWDASGSHIFGIPPAVVTPPQSIPPNIHLMAMDHSFSSRTSSPSMLDRMNESCSTIGLPSDYPLHRKNTSFGSADLEEELQDFGIFLDENTSFEREALHTSLSLCGDEATNSFGKLAAATSGSNSNGNNGPKKKRHRRMHSDLFTVDSCTDTPTATKLDQAHHRRHNYALGQKEFNESVLTELFDDVAIAEVRSYS